MQQQHRWSKIGSWHRDSLHFWTKKPEHRKTSTAFLCEWPTRPYSAWWSLCASFYNSISGSRQAAEQSAHWRRHGRHQPVCSQRWCGGFLSVSSTNHHQDLGIQMDNLSHVSQLYYLAGSKWVISMKKTCRGSVFRFSELATKPQVPQVCSRVHLHVHSLASSTSFV